MSNHKKQSKKLVPMQAVKCPLCDGKGRIISSIIKTYVKCNGCEGKGWVEVHYAEVVKAPKVLPVDPNKQNVPYVSPNMYPQGGAPGLNPYPYTSGGGGGNYPLGGAGGGSVTSTDINGSYKYTSSSTNSSNKWTCNACGKEVSVGEYHSCPSIATTGFAYTQKQDGSADWIDVSNTSASSIKAT